MAETVFCEGPRTKGVATGLSRSSYAGKGGCVEDGRLPGMLPPPHLLSSLFQCVFDDELAERLMISIVGV